MAFELASMVVKMLADDSQLGSVLIKNQQKIRDLDDQAKGMNLLPTKNDFGTAETDITRILEAMKTVGPISDETTAAVTMLQLAWSESKAATNLKEQQDGLTLVRDKLVELNNLMQVQMAYKSQLADTFATALNSTGKLATNVAATTNTASTQAIKTAQIASKAAVAAAAANKQSIPLALHPQSGLPVATVATNLQKANQQMNLFKASIITMSGMLFYSAKGASLLINTLGKPVIGLGSLIGQLKRTDGMLTGLVQKIQRMQATSIQPRGAASLPSNLGLANQQGQNLLQTLTQLTGLNLSTVLSLGSLAGFGLGIRRLTRSFMEFDDEMKMVEARMHGLGIEQTIGDYRRFQVELARTGTMSLEVAKNLSNQAMMRAPVRMRQDYQDLVIAAQAFAAKTGMPVANMLRQIEFGEENYKNYQRLLKQAGEQVRVGATQQEIMEKVNKVIKEGVGIMAVQKTTFESTINRMKTEVSLLGLSFVRVLGAGPSAIFRDMAERITVIARRMSDWIMANRQWLEQMATAATRIAVMVGGMVALRVGAGMLVKALGFLGPSILAAINPLSWLTALIPGLASGIGPTGILTGGFNMLTGSIKEAALASGEGLVSALKLVANTAGGVVTGLAKILTGAAMSATVVGAVAGIPLIFSGLKDIFSVDITSVIGIITSAFKLFTIAVKGAVVALGLFLFVPAIITLLALAANHIRKLSKDGRDFWKILQDAGKPVVEWVNNAWKVIQREFVIMRSALIDGWNSFVDQSREILISLEMLITRILKDITGKDFNIDLLSADSLQIGWKKFQKWLIGFWKDFTASIANAGIYIKLLVLQWESLWTNKSNLMDWLLDFFKNLMDLFGRVMMVLSEIVVNAGAAAIAKLLDKIPLAVKMLVPGLSIMETAMKKGAKNFEKTLDPKTLKDNFDYIKDAFKDLKPLEWKVDPNIQSQIDKLNETLDKAKDATKEKQKKERFVEEAKQFGTSVKAGLFDWSKKTIGIDPEQWWNKALQGDKGIKDLKGGRPIAGGFMDLQALWKKVQEAAGGGQFNTMEEIAKRQETEQKKTNTLLEQINEKGGGKPPEANPMVPAPAAGGV